MSANVLFIYLTSWRKVIECDLTISVLGRRLMIAWILGYKMSAQ